MALTNEQLKKIKEMQAKGLDSVDILSSIADDKSREPVRVSSVEKYYTPTDTDKMLGGYTKSAGEYVKQRYSETVEDVRETGVDYAKTSRDTAAEINRRFDNAVKAGMNPFLAEANKYIFGGVEIAQNQLGSLMIGGGKVFLSKKQEDFLKEKFGDAAGYVAGKEWAKKSTDYINNLKENDPVTYTNVRSALTFGETVLDILGFKKFKDVAAPMFERKAAKETGETVVEQAGKEVGEAVALLPERDIYQSADEVVDAVEQALKKEEVSKMSDTAKLRHSAEEAAPSLTFREKYIGLTPDQKARLQNDPQLFQDYINITHARNAADITPTGEVIPSAYGYGAQQAKSAVEVLEKKLNSTGNIIGQTRERLGTVAVPQADIEVFESTFKSQLDRLNLTVRGGQVVQKPGTINKLGSKADMTAINELWGEFLVFKQSPTLQQAIDLRDAFGSKIAFAKGAREVSNSVDPLSRMMRRDIANSSAKIVGPTEAKYLEEYSSFIEAYNDLRRYTDRNAGGEYLLRLVLSGRGDEARILVETINKYTGVDLMNHATYMTLSTDFLGNQNQKNLFRQEITKAGFDAARLATGDPNGLKGILSDYAAKNIMDPETILKGASMSHLSPAQKAALGVAGAGGIYFAVEEDGNVIPLVGVAAMANPTTKQMMLSEIRALKKTWMAKAADTTNPLSERRAAEKAVNNLTKQEAELLESFSAGATPAQLGTPLKGTSEALARKTYYHGTSKENAKSILEGGVDAKKSNTIDADEGETDLFASFDRGYADGWQPGDEMGELVGETIKIVPKEGAQILDYKNYPGDITVEEARRLGYDAFATKDGLELQILNPDAFEFSKL